MTRFSLMFASFWIAQGFARVVTVNSRDVEDAQFKRFKSPISDLPTLNTSAVISRHPIPSFESAKGSNLPFYVDTTVVEQECLDPLDRPISQDCEALCEYIQEFQGPVVLNPYEIQTFENGHCAFGIANLEACDRLNIDPLNVLYGYCRSMYSDCALNGYDGYIRFTGPSFAIALSGTPAAPPYQREPCT